MQSDISSAQEHPPEGQQLPAILSKNTYCDLHQWGLLSLSGEDKVSYLQGQVAQDIAQVAIHAGTLTAHCNPKGRILGLFRLIEYGAGLGLLLTRDLLPALHQRLQMYVLRSQVQLQDCSEQVRIIGLAGPDIASLLSQHITLPNGSHPAVHQNNIQLIRLDGNPTRWLLLGEAQELNSLLDAIAPTLTPVDSDTWRLLDILAGQPTLYLETREQFVPQMVNLDLLGGISFKKGCYTGQEIVARSHYLGKLKRRMFRLNLASGNAKPGMAVFSENSPTQAIGTVVDSAPHPDGGEALLAVLRIEAATQTLHLDNPDGPQLRLAQLPYALPEFDG